MIDAGSELPATFYAQRDRVVDVELAVSYQLSNFILDVAVGGVLRL